LLGFLEFGDDETITRAISGSKRSMITNNPVLIERKACFTYCLDFLELGGKQKGVFLDFLLKFVGQRT
jgi:hypothetical protein